LIAIFQLELRAFPTDRPRSVRPDHGAGSVGFELGEALTAELEALSRRLGLTLSMTVLAAWVLVLSRLSGQGDVVVGVPSVDRWRADVGALIGAFAGIPALPVHLSDDPAVEELLRRVKTVALGVQAGQDLSLGQVLKPVAPARSRSQGPLFQAAFAWTGGEARFDQPRLMFEEIDSPDAAAIFDLSLAVSKPESGIVGGLEYATALFDRETIERWAGYLRQALSQMAADAGRAVSNLPLMSAEERHRLLVEWNATEADYPKDVCVHELFAARVAQAPDATAVICEDGSLSFGELNAQADRLAGRLRSLGVGPDVLVAICVERSPEMIVGLLGILKAGGAYVPLDPSYPVERLRFMLDDAAPAVVLCHCPTRAALHQALTGAALAPAILDVAADIDQGADQPPDDLSPRALGLTSSHLAYVIYTSGSTGRPKGVCVEHRNVVNYLHWAVRAYRIGEGVGAPVNTPLGFDATVTSLWGPLVSGRPVLLLAENAEQLWALSRVLSEEDAISLVKLTPAHLSLLQDPELVPAIDPDAGTAMVVGGEVLTTSSAMFWKRRSPKLRLINEYGPTEATVGCTTYELEGEVERLHVPIGRPIANTRIYLLNAQLEPVPLGTPGEIYIGGAGVARGYLNRPELTGERFIASPFVEGDRLYRTGDLARHLPDGNLEFLGRNDFQVKVRGFRIELAEIEARLAAHSGVREAVVLAREDEPGDKRLVAYYTASEVDGGPSVAALRAHLLSALPDYMAPTSYVLVPALPLTPNGKVDRSALPEPGATSRRGP
jgi:amino acid adenylation domain-containing protein